MFKGLVGHCGVPLMWDSRLFLFLWLSYLGPYSFFHTIMRRLTAGSKATWSMDHNCDTSPPTPCQQTFLLYKLILSGTFSQ